MLTLDYRLRNILLAMGGRGFIDCYHSDGIWVFFVRESIFIIGRFLLKKLDLPWKCM